MTKITDNFACAAPTSATAPNGSNFWHIDGTISLVLNKPANGVMPKVVFTNNPKVDRS